MPGSGSSSALRLVAGGIGTGEGDVEDLLELVQSVAGEQADQRGDGGDPVQAALGARRGLPTEAGLQDEEERRRECGTDEGVGEVPQRPLLVEVARCDVR